MIGLAALALSAFAALKINQNLGSGGAQQAQSVAAAAGDLTGTTLASNVVTSSLTAVGTIVTGVWDATTVAVAAGGTGAETLTGILLGNGASAFTALTTSSGIFGAISDETGGSGVLVGSASPAITGEATYVGLTGTNATSTGTLAVPVGASVVTPVAGNTAIDTTSGQLRFSDVTGTTRVVVGNQYPGFSYATTSWTGTTTIPLGTARVAETWNDVQCFTDAGTLQVSFNDGTNRMNFMNASTTVGTVGLTSNNTFTSGEKRYVDVGTPASTPLKISCTVSKSITSD